VPQRWRRQVATIRAAVDAALALLPADSPLRTTDGDRFGFFECERALAELLRTEPQTKTLLGAYSSARLRAFSNLCTRTWRRDGCHVADAADELAAALRFAVPNARREADEASRKADELAVARDEAVRVAARHRADYERECAAWGIAPLGEGSAVS
jgi:hypothetical protein